MNKNIITIGDTTVLCTEIEYQQLQSISLNFLGIKMEDAEGYTEKNNNTVISFKDLNTPESDNTELCISCFGDDGFRSNSIADMEAQRYFNCFFSVLVFLDNCNTFFRTTDEEQY